MSYVVIIERPGDVETRIERHHNETVARLRALTLAEQTGYPCRVVIRGTRAQTAQMIFRVEVAGGGRE